MWVVLLGFGIAYLAGIIMLPTVIRLLNRYDVLDPINNRKVHHEAKPTLGGIVIYFSFLISVLMLSPLFENQHTSYFLLGLTGIFLLGAKDDLQAINPWSKMLGQIAVIGIVVVLGGYNILNDHAPIDTAILIPLIFLIYIFLINAFNLIDGIDGLATSLGIWTCGVMGVWFGWQGHLSMMVLSFTFCGSLFAFLKYNLFLSQIFMGDSGSMVIGLIIAFLAIHMLNGLSALNTFQQDLGANILFSLLLIPSFDACRVAIVRIIQGRSPLDADRNHIHHLLLATGFTHLQSTSLLVVSSIIILVLGIWLTTYSLMIAMSIQLLLVGGMSFYLHYLVIRKKKLLALQHKRP